MCDCIEQIDKQLKKHNTRIETPIIITPVSHDMRVAQRVTVATEKIESRKHKVPIRIFAAFCPFCGEKYAPEPQKHKSERELASNCTGEMGTPVATVVL